MCVKNPTRACWWVILIPLSAGKYGWVGFFLHFLFTTFYSRTQNYFEDIEKYLHSGRVLKGFPLSFVKYNLLCGKIRVITLEGMWNVPGSGAGCLRGPWWFVLPEDFVSRAEHKPPGLHHLFLIKAEEWITTRFRGRSGRCEAHIDIKKRKKKKKTQQNWVYCTTVVSMLIMVLKIKGDALLGKHRISTKAGPKICPLLQALLQIFNVILSKAILLFNHLINSRVRSLI